MWNSQQQDTGQSVAGSQEVLALGLWEVPVQVPEYSLEGMDQMWGYPQMVPIVVG